MKSEERNLALSLELTGVLTSSVLSAATSTQWGSYLGPPLALESKVITRSETCTERMARRGEAGRDKDALFPIVVSIYFHLKPLLRIECFMPQSTRSNPAPYGSW